MSPLHAVLGGDFLGCTKFDAYFSYCIHLYKPFGVSCDGFFLFTNELMSSLDDDDDDNTLGCSTNISVASVIPCCS